MFLEFEKKYFLLQNMRKMALPFFHDASILALVGVFLTPSVLYIFSASKMLLIWSSDSYDLLHI